MRWIHLCGAACIASFLPSEATADLIIDTSSGPFGGLAPFGESNVEVRGQTFTVTGPETELDSFSFLYEARLDLAPDFIDFAAYVIARDGSKAAGPALFVSAPVSSTNNGGAGGFELFTFNTGGVQLVADIEYVAFLSQSQFLDGIDGIAQTPVSDFDLYSGGKAVLHPTGFEGILTIPWFEFGFVSGRDQWFIATFSEPIAVPESPALALCAASLLSLFFFGRQTAKRT